MADLMNSIFVIVGVGIIIIAVFAVIRMQTRTKEKALADYCRIQGYTYNKMKEPLRTELRISGDSFSLTSTMTALRQEEQSGSSSLKKDTVWTFSGGNGARSSYIFGSVPTTGNWDRLPAWVRNAAVQKLIGEMGAGFDADRVQQVNLSGKNAFLLFEEIPGEGLNTIERLKPLLCQWPSIYKLVIQSSPTEIRIHAADCFIQDTTLLEKVIRLGATVVGAL